MTAEEKIKLCYEQLRLIAPFEPKVGIVLGTGLGNFADELEIEKIIPYSEIKVFPTSTVQGHKGAFVFAKSGDTKIIIMQGRVHYYEGYDIEDTVLGVRVMRLLGVQKLILTNAAGGINSEFSNGCLMAITDHISSFVPSPLRGKNIDLLGERFPDMTEIYTKKLLKTAKNCAERNGIDLKEGIYVQLSGPNYETSAEINMLKILGADAVGMSTVCEAMAAHHAGMEVLGISCITNQAAGLGEGKLSHTEVQIGAQKLSLQFTLLLKEILKEIV